jgi:hypothetical protein
MAFEPHSCALQRMIGLAHLLMAFFLCVHSLSNGVVRPRELRVRTHRVCQLCASPVIAGPPLAGWESATIRPPYRRRSLASSCLVCAGTMYSPACAPRRYAHDVKALRRSGKSSMQSVVFHKLSPHDTLFIDESTELEVKYVCNNQFVQFQIWDFPGDYDPNGTVVPPWLCMLCVYVVCRCPRASRAHHVRRRGAVRRRHFQGQGRDCLRYRRAGTRRGSDCGTRRVLIADTMDRTSRTMERLSVCMTSQHALPRSIPR